MRSHPSRVAASVISFINGAQWAFLACIIISRIGLYGFSLGEVEIRQVGIPERVRGRINGFANALTTIPSFILYGGGALLSSTADFKFLVIGSGLSVVCAAVIFTYWAGRQSR